MTLKLKSREKLLAANAIGNVKLALTASEYDEAVAFVVTAIAALKDLNDSLSGCLNEVPVTGGVDGNFKSIEFVQAAVAGSSANLSDKISAYDESRNRMRDNKAEKPKP